MKPLVLLAMMLSLRSMAQAATVKDTKLSAVPFTAVRIDDAFWAPRIEVNRTKTVPHDFRMCEETGRIDNFAKAGGLMPGEFRGIYFDDSDLYKAIEGACYTLLTHPDPALDKYLDGVIAKIAAAQQPDGYINTYYTLKEKGKRWTNLKDMHELYCGGHLIEAAVAHHRATGKRNLLDVAIKFADHVDAIFGDGKRHDVCGHEEIELALVKLHHLTKQEKYLKLASFFIDERGRSTHRKTYGPYYQDHKPLPEQTEVVGHAVRAMYFFCGAADVAAASGDKKHLPILEKLWESVALRKMYVTGGIGSRHDGEAFGDDYELPNETAYCETCAAIGNGLWNHRMAILTGDAKYVDVLERVLYNGFLSGVSLNGEKFFYVNPLASRGGHHRQSWYGCACCPSNVVRFLPSLPGYLYATGENAVYVNVYAASTSTLDLGANKVQIVQQTRYPWDGSVKLTVSPAQPAEFDVYLRIPGWCPDASLKLNGQPIGKLDVVKGYTRIGRPWKAGDVLELELPMPALRVKSHPSVKDNIGRVAIQRGPVVYCLEAADNGGRVYHLSLPPTSELTPKHKADLLGGVTVIEGKALAHRKGEALPELVDFTAIPYYAWDNREAGQMMVWVPEDPKLAEPLAAPTIANTSKVSVSHCNSADTPLALNDGAEPRNSGDTALPRMTWWDHRGSEEWVQYDFAGKKTVREVEVYWFDDTGRGSCRIPASWQLQYKDGAEWKPVASASGYIVKPNDFNRVTFASVDTTALRVVVKLQPGFSGGILEWRVK